MKGYHDIVGDGGSRVLEQVAEQRTRITDGLAGVRPIPSLRGFAIRGSRSRNCPKHPLAGPWSMLRSNPAVRLKRARTIFPIGGVL
jgi:hypothetical protein